MKKLPSINEINLLMEECAKSALKPDLVFDLLNKFDYTTQVLELCKTILENNNFSLNKTQLITLHLIRYELMIKTKKACDVS